MAEIEELKQISRVKGVDQYIIVDQNGKLLAHDIKNPQKASAMVSSCGKNSFAIGKTRLEYVVFSRENKKNIFIFPIGNYYLGVVKQKSINNIAMADNIIKFLKGLL
ncbi:MAG: roadblock/LC7 domain-containing protein [Deltaproteobacteria bacterium]|nr:roadblock/LC7 domain-containing protein [Deltaproteobacteria bacterium]